MPPGVGYEFTRPQGQQQLPLPPLGQSIQQPPDPGVVKAPPRDEQELEQRKSKWRQVLSAPEMTAALLQFSADITAPRSIFQSGLNQTINAVGGGLGAAGRVEQARFEREEQLRASEREDVKAEADKEKAAAATTGAEASKTTAETGKERLEAVEKPKTEAEIGGIEATTEATRGKEKREEDLHGLNKAFLDASVELRNAQSQDARAQASTRYKTAQAQYINALANKSSAEVRERESETQIQLNEANAKAAEELARLREVQAEAGGFSSTQGGTVQQLNVLAASLKDVAAEQGKTISDSEALLQAQAMIKTNSTLSKQQFISDFIMEMTEKNYKSPTEEQMVQWYETAGALADRLGLQDTTIPQNPATAPPTPVTDPGAGLPDEQRIQLFQQSELAQKGYSLGQQKVQGVGPDGKEKTGFPVNLDGIQLDIDGKPLVY